MFTLVCMVIFIASVILSIALSFPLLYAMIVGAFCFAFAAKHKGFSFKEVIKMMSGGMKSSLVVIKVFVFIGLITASWRCSGTIQFFVYWGIKLISPKMFVLCAFIFTCIISFLLGTSLGTVGTIGIVIMVLAQSGNVNPIIVGGAIISGAYFGDRCSPSSSSALLVSVLTQTKLFTNIKNMIKSAFVPFIITSILYLSISFFYPMQSNDTSLCDDITNNYSLTFFCAIPAIVLLLLALLKIKISIAMLCSAIVASVIAFVFQNSSFAELFNSLIFGYKVNFSGWFSKIIPGGGIVSMLMPGANVLLASSYAGIIEKSGIWSPIENKILLLSKKIGIFPTTFLTASLTALLACNQTLAVMLTHDLMRKPYKNTDNYIFANNLEDTAILIAPIIPWNIALSVPLAMLGIGPLAVVFAFYLFIVPLWRLFSNFLFSQKNNAQN